MKTLDQMAKDLFISFCELENKSGSWEHLSNARRNAWRKEVLLMGRYYLIQLQKELKPLPPNRAQASFEIGYNTGVRAERIATQTLVQKLYETLENEYDNSQES